MMNMYLIAWKNWTPIPGLPQVKCRNSLPVYLKTTLYLHQRVKQYSSPNQETKTSRSNLLSWTRNFGQTCQNLRKNKTRPSDASHTKFLQQLDLSITPFVWFTRPNLRTQMEINIRLGYIWNRQFSIPEPWFWTHFHMLMRYAENRRSKPQYLLIIKDLLGKRRYSEKSFTKQLKTKTKQISFSMMQPGKGKELLKTLPQRMKILHSIIGCQQNLITLKEKQSINLGKESLKTRETNSKATDRFAKANKERSNKNRTNSISDCRTHSTFSNEVVFFFWKILGNTDCPLRIFSGMEKVTTFKKNSYCKTKIQRKRLTYIPKRNRQFVRKRRYSRDGLRYPVFHFQPVYNSKENRQFQSHH